MSEDLGTEQQLRIQRQNTDLQATELELKNNTICVRFKYFSNWRTNMNRSKKKEDKGRDFTTKSAIYLEYIEPTLNRRGTHGFFSLELEAFSVGRWRSKLERIVWNEIEGSPEESMRETTHNQKMEEPERGTNPKSSIYLNFTKYEKMEILFYFWNSLKDPSMGFNQTQTQAHYEVTNSLYGLLYPNSLLL